MELSKSAKKPIIIADTQDNPGAVRIRHHRHAARLVRYKPSAATGGSTIRNRQGAHDARRRRAVSRWRSRKSGIPGDAPYQGTFVVENSPMESSSRPSLFWRPRHGHGAVGGVAESAIVRVVVSSHKAQLADQSMYRYVAIEPDRTGHSRPTRARAFPRRFRGDRRETLLICAAPAQCRPIRDVAMEAIASWHPTSSRTAPFSTPQLKTHDNRTDKCP